METSSISRIFTLLCDFSLIKFNERVREQIAFVIDTTIRIFENIR